MVLLTLSNCKLDFLLVAGMGFMMMKAEAMVSGRKCFLLALLVISLALAGCAEVGKSKLGSSQPKLTTVRPKSNWRSQAEQLEDLGDYSGACRVVRKQYLRYPEIETADYFALLLSYLNDKELADWWAQESDKRLSCRVGVEYFFRLKIRPEDELSAVDRMLLLDLARLLSTGCEVGEDVKTEAENFLLTHPLQSAGGEINIGCLLPLSGPNAAAGERFLRGMEVALGVYAQSAATDNVINQVSEQSSRPGVVDNSRRRSVAKEVSLPGLRVFFCDTAGDAESARAGVDYLVNEKKVDMILGPYAGKAANYAAAQAQSLSVTMVSLSPLLRNLERYPNVFQHYPTIRNQAVALADLARVRMGIKKFAMLVPQNRYGREFAEKFKDQVHSWGGQIVRQVEYDSDRPDFGPAIRELIGAQRYRKFKEKRKTYEAWSKARKRQAAQDQVAADGAGKADKQNQLAALAREIGIDDAELNLGDEILPRPLLQYDFEAIVIPDREQTLKLLIPQLAFYDLDECFLLGGRYWNSADFLTSVADYVEGAFFIGACLPPHTDVPVDGDSPADEVAGAVATPVAEVTAATVSPAPAVPAEIQARFQTEFARLNQGQTPGLLETYGFDTIMLLRQLVAGSPEKPDAETWRRLLSGCRDLPLAAGLANTLPDGEIAQKLYPLTFKQGHIQIVGGSCF